MTLQGSIHARASSPITRQVPGLDSVDRATSPYDLQSGAIRIDGAGLPKMTRPARLAIHGGSAGGIFVGRAITERPDLFAAAVPAVGVMDALRLEASANGAANIPEFGSVKKHDEFRGLLAMSSYHHVKDGVRYPAVMSTHGVNDIRVDVWQSAKFVSRLATATKGGPVLMRLEYDSGHGQGSTRQQSVLRSADLYAFLLWQFGEPGFQPVP